MSASSKKKLRKEQYAAELTEKQLKEKAEGKKLKAYSVTFIVCILVVVVAAIAILGVTTVNRYGLIEKNTVAATVDGVDFNSVEMNYYFADSVNTTYSQWETLYGDSVSLYAMMMGLDMTQPLDEQYYDEEAGTTWADYFYEVAMEQAKNDYILCKLADEEGFVTPEEDLANLESSLNQMELYMALSGYGNLDEFLRATYGNGADEESFREYGERTTRAAAFYNAYSDSLTYDDADLRAHEAENYDLYTSYSYASYYVGVNSYLEGGTEDEDGNITYSDEEKETARAKAEEVAKMLAEYDSIEGLDAAIASLPINAEVEGAASTKYEDALYSTVSATLIDWISDEARQEGDITSIEYTYTSTDEDGNETTTVNGYYVVMFQERNENLRPLANVRHLLVSYESDDGTTTYTDEDKAEAYAEAETILEEWKAGEATEESFIALVQEKSDDTSAAEGGLFEDITPEQGIYVDNFTNWAVDDTRKAGDTGIIETEYGCHIMYYVGDSDMTYRDYMIANDLRVSDLALWFESVTADVTVTKGNISRINTGAVILTSTES